MVVKNIEMLYDLIKECRIRRLTTNESVEYIKQNGIKLSERTYRRYKKEWEDKIEERILEIGERESESELLRRLDTVKQVEKEYWNLFSQTKNESLKGQLLRYVLDLQEMSQGCFSSIDWRSRCIKREMKKEEERQQEKNRRWSEEEKITI